MAGIRTQDCEPEHKPFSPAFIVMFRRLWGFIPGEGRWGQICCWPLLSHISLSHHSGACGKGREQARVLRGVLEKQGLQQACDCDWGPYDGQWKQGNQSQDPARNPRGLGGAQSLQLGCASFPLRTHSWART